MKIRFQADADLNPAIGRGVRRQEPAIDWRSAWFLRVGLPDPQVLDIAADDGRVLVSRDIKTMPGHFAAFMATRSSPGVILIPSRVRLGEAVERLIRLWESWSAEDIENQIWWLSR